MDFDIFAYIIIPLLICLARVVDVTIGTLRIIFLSRGMRYIAPVLGFFEVIIWLLAISQIIQNLTNVTNYIAYGLGFAIGNYVGIVIENRISLGHVVLRIITRRTATNLKEWLDVSERKFTVIDAKSDWGDVNIIFMPMKRKDVPEVIRKVKDYNPNAFYTIEDVRWISGSTLKDGYISEKKKISRRFPRSKKK